MSLYSALATGRFYLSFTRLTGFFVVLLCRGYSIQAPNEVTMKNLDTTPSVFVVAPASLPDPEPAPRLIVLVPEFEADPAIMARKIRDAAKALESRIQLIGLSRDAVHEPGIRRRLVTLAAMIEDSTLFVESKVEIGRDWLNAILPHWHRGDVIVCFAGPQPGPANKPLHQILQSKLDAAVYVLSGVQIQDGSPRSNWLPNLMAWTGSIVLLLAFFWLQAGLIRPTGNWVQSVLLYLSIAVEAGSIWFWNNLFS
jgi:hypothetical protein